MTEEEELKKIVDDLESLHIDGDDLIVRFLAAQGFTELSTLYEEMTNNVWYA